VRRNVATVWGSFFPLPLSRFIALDMRWTRTTTAHLQAFEVFPTPLRMNLSTYSGIHFHSVHGIRGGVGAAPPARGSAPAPLLNQLAYRYKLIHDYFNTDVEIIWKAVHEDVPQLKILSTGTKVEAPD
jgi:hypothetical protein